MNTKTSYRNIENNSNVIREDQMRMGYAPPAYCANQQQPPVYYTNQQQQPVASAPAQPAINIQTTNMSTPSATPQLMPITNVAFGHPVGPRSSTMTCPKCHNSISTKVRYSPTAKTHIACLLLSWTACCCFCFIPYCMDSCRNANHSCPVCNTFLGTYES